MLTVKDLHIRFKTDEDITHAVKGVNLFLEKGKTLGIVGESGSGKSVTSLAIMRLLASNAEISQGEILFHGQNLLTLSESGIRKIRGKTIAMIFQEPMTSLNPVFTCGFQVAEILMLHEGMNYKEAKAKTLFLFEQVELPNPERVFEAYPHEISGGQKQRVMIAMAISCNPEILIADEPTTALDVTIQKEILHLLQKIQKETQMGMIFISHDLGVISEIADTVSVMYRGEVVESGNVKQVFLSPQHPYTQGLIACRPQMNRSVQYLPTVEEYLTGILNHSEEENQITEESALARHETLQKAGILFSIQSLKTWFPLRGGWVGGKKEYIKAVDSVSFDIYKGETLGLVGESGCGKTTLGRSILRLTAPTEGKIMYNGSDIRLVSERVLRQMRKEIQFIFQDPYSSLNPKMTIGEAILEPLKVHNLFQNDKERKAKTYEWLEKVGLKPEHYHRYPHEFSGGQRQRICIARALALSPSFVICDESVSALDVSVQAQILNLLRQLQSELGLTLLFISHDLSVIKHISDRVMVMQNGKIVETGYSEELYKNPKTEYTRQLLEAIPEGIHS